MKSAEPYSNCGLVQDMLAVSEIIRSFDTDRMQSTAKKIAETGRLFITGEGSSRLFPAKSVMGAARRHGWPLTLFSEAGLQAQEYDLSRTPVLALSNSGRTAEVIGLFDSLQRAGHPQRYSLTAFADSKLESLAHTGYVLQCGEEHAVAATKSVIEQALFCRALVEHIVGVQELAAQRQQLADAFETALTSPIDEKLVDRIARAGTIHWAGRNDGVAEELTLKTNEITRRPSDYLEGTYAVHGIEEVMNPDDVVIWINPYPGSEDKFHEVLCEGVGMTIIAVASRPTRFPTITIPDGGEFSPYVQMAAGWNILVEVGLRLGIDVDKPVRARKVGNEFEQPKGT